MGQAAPPHFPAQAGPGHAAHHQPIATGDKTMLYRTMNAAPVFGLRREIDRLFDDAFSRDGMAWTPAVDIKENDSDLRVETELPGLRPEDVEVTAENGILTVRADLRIVSPDISASPGGRRVKDRSRVRERHPRAANSQNRTASAASHSDRFQQRKEAGVGQRRLDFRR